MSKEKQRWPWFARLLDNLDNAFNDVMANDDYPKQVVADTDLDDGSTIEIELFRDNTLDVYFYRNKQTKEDNLPNIVQYLEDNLPDWDTLEEEYRDAVMDVWQQHGFRDEADYWHYRMG